MLGVQLVLSRASVSSKVLSLELFWRQVLEMIRSKDSLVRQFARTMPSILFNSSVGVGARWGAD